MENYLKNLYKKFLRMRKYYFSLDIRKNSTSTEALELSEKKLGEFFDNYYKIPFLSFLKDVKDIIYSKTAYDFVLSNSSEDWKLWPYLKFLKQERVITVKKSGTVSLLKKALAEAIPKPQTENEIKEKIEKKLMVKVKESEPVINLFKKFREGEENKFSSSPFANAREGEENKFSSSPFAIAREGEENKFSSSPFANAREFEVKAKWDQMPISQGSAVFVAKKILEKIPLNKKFLFVGDDDFISVVLGIAEPNIESLVVDADEKLLDCLNMLAEKFNLKIETRKVDIRKEKSLGEKFIGFLTSPVYTEAGVREFVLYGKEQLGEDGGIIFLEAGDEAIGNRFLFLQDFFTKNNLIINEIITGKVFYPYIELYKEDKEIFKRLSSVGISEKVIKNSPKLAASLWIFEYLPQKPKRVKFNKPIYAYL